MKVEFKHCTSVQCATQCKMQNETQLCWRRCVNEKQKKQTVCSIKSYRALHWMQCKMQCTTQCKMQNEIWLCRGVVLTRARRNKQFVPPPFPSLRQKLNGVTFFFAMKFPIRCYCYRCYCYCSCYCYCYLEKGTNSLFCLLLLSSVRS